MPEKPAFDEVPSLSGAPSRMAKGARSRDAASAQTINRLAALESSRSPLASSARRRIPWLAIAGLMLLLGAVAFGAYVYKSMRDAAGHAAIVAGAVLPAAALTPLPESLRPAAPTAQLETIAELKAPAAAEDPGRAAPLAASAPLAAAVPAAAVPAAVPVTRALSVAPKVVKRNPPAAAAARIKPANAALAAAPEAPVEDADVELLAALIGHPNFAATGPRAPRAAVTPEPARLRDTRDIAALVQRCTARPSKQQSLSCQRRVCQGHWGKADACPKALAPAATTARKAT